MQNIKKKNNNQVVFAKYVLTFKQSFFIIQVNKSYY